MSEVAQQIIDMGILTKKSYDDCQHIVAAVIYCGDCILSWNFKHIVNIKTIRGVGRPYLCDRCDWELLRNNF